MQSPEFMNMFSVPFTFSRFPAHERVNSLLKNFIFAQEKSGTAANPRPFEGEGERITIAFTVGSRCRTLKKILVQNDITSTGTGLTLLKKLPCGARFRRVF